MNILHRTRPFNLRYVVRERSERYAPELLRTHRTAKANWLYIHRQHGIDELGPVPDWSARNDLVDYGRCAPSRANDPALEGVALWERADRHATATRPDEPVCAHVVGSLPLGQDCAAWRNLIEGFAEDHLTSQGMVVDWAIHHRAKTDDRSEVLPHVHMLITTRVFDPTHAEVGRIRQNWLRSNNARKALAEKWWAHTGLYPSGYALAARAAARPDRRSDPATRDHRYPIDAGPARFRGWRLARYLPLKGPSCPTPILSPNTSARLWSMWSRH